MKANVYVTRKIPQPGLDLLANAGLDVEVNPYDKVLSQEELTKTVRGRDGVLCLLTDRIDDEIMESAGAGCKGFANYAVGYDNIDIKAATSRKLPISNTPGVLTDATSDQAWALLFSTARRIVESDRFMRSEKWQGWGPMQFLGADITGATLGIIGAGRIGTSMAMKSVGFNMRVLYYDIQANEELEKSTGARKVDIDTLLKESDFVSVHITYTPETTHLLGEREINLMKKSAVLINTSRGPVIDETALVKALKEKSIFGAGLDVYENEPKMTEGLKDLSNVVVCPHIASATTKTRATMATMAAENLVAMLQGERPPNIVNPEIYK